jgi:hypothetical protein
MHCEYPVQEFQAKVYVNRPVGVVLLDGTRHYGVVESCEKGCLVLKPFAFETEETVEAESAGKRGASKRGSVRTKARRKKRTSTKAVLPPPVPYGPPVPFGPPVPAFGPPVTLELASIGLLFALML